MATASDVRNSPLRGRGVGRDFELRWGLDTGSTVTAGKTWNSGARDCDFGERQAEKAGSEQDSQEYV